MVTIPQYSVGSHRYTVWVKTCSRTPPLTILESERGVTTQLSSCRRKCVSSSSSNPLQGLFTSTRNKDLSFGYCKTRNPKSSYFYTRIDIFVCLGIPIKRMIGYTAYIWINSSKLSLSIRPDMRWYLKHNSTSRFPSSCQVVGDLRETL